MELSRPQPAQFCLLETKGSLVVLRGTDFGQLVLAWPLFFWLDEVVLAVIVLVSSP
ncbi:hypothetical protein HNQ08_005600 [Deinococcus humi]|uniref:Uncharacterized protein n=1 Tax=Deinococcus humi TaxID=662880 RepID=A0A7W8K099_9DEIO|nr:hypothetical protein [Deinococcus humi]